MRHPAAFIAALSAVLLLSACNRGDDAQLADIDNQIATDDTDPALAGALEDQITVDPALTQQTNPGARAPAGAPSQPYPATDTRSASVRRSADSPPLSQDERVAGAFAQEGISVCGVPFRYDARYAGRMPADFPLLPGARVTEAAGSDRGDCRMRVATFTTEAPVQRVLDFYADRAARAGYSAEHQRRGGDHVIAGANAADDGAYYVIVTPRPQGSDVALIANKGR